MDGFKILTKSKKHLLFNKWQSVIMKIQISHESCIDNPDMLSSGKFNRFRNGHHNLAPAMIKKHNNEFNKVNSKIVTN